MDFTDEQQTFIDGLVGKARVSAREKVDAEYNKIKDDQEAANLVANEEWQTLASTHEARVKELEPLEAKVAEYDTLLQGMLEARVKALGKTAATAVKSLPETMSPIQKLSWVNENVKLFQPAGDGVGTPARNVDLHKNTPKPGAKPLFSLS